jgi:hypothetical protein
MRVGPRGFLLNAFVLLLVLWPGTLAAQESVPMVDISYGSFGFEDAAEFFVGGAARWYVLPRVSLGPEFLHLRGDRHTHEMFTGNVVMDLTRGRDQPGAAVPFALIAAGVSHGRGISMYGAPFRSTTATVMTGVGIRAVFSRRVTISGDLRIGLDELYGRLAGTITLRLGR